MRRPSRSRRARDLVRGRVRVGFRVRGWVRIRVRVRVRVRSRVGVRVRVRVRVWRATGDVLREPQR